MIFSSLLEAASGAVVVGLEVVGLVVEEEACVRAAVSLRLVVGVVKDKEMGAAPVVWILTVDIVVVVVVVVLGSVGSNAPSSSSSMDVMVSSLSSSSSLEERRAAFLFDSTGVSCWDDDDVLFWVVGEGVEGMSSSSLGLPC